MSRRPNAGTVQVSLSLPRIVRGEAAFWHTVLGGSDFLDEVSEASDRSLAILGGAILESELRAMIMRSMTDGEVAAKLLAPSGALGAFQAQIDAAYLFGLIGADIRSDLKKVAIIRNKFAHEALGVALDQSPLKERCRDLKAPDRYVRYRPSQETTGLLLQTPHAGRIVQIGLDITGPEDPRQRARWRLEATVQLLALVMAGTSLARPAATTPSASWERTQ